MLDPDVKQRWLAALRSGQYLQGQEWLKQQWRNAEDEPETRYCCLGVVCDVLSKENSGYGHWSGSTSALARKEAADLFVAEDGAASDTGLPLRFRETIGLAEAEQEQLILMNDNGENDFAKIADWIEANL